MAGEMWELEKTQLGIAIKEGSVGAVNRLLKKGENALFKDKKGNTYLHLIATMYRPYIINLLLEAGVDINARNIHGYSALHVTAVLAEPCHVPDLMAAGIDPEMSDLMGRTAKDIASGQTKWLDLYRKYEPGLRIAVKNRDMEKIEYLLHAWSACHLAVDGKDMRHFAASLTYHDIVEVVDTHRFSLMAVYGVLAQNYERLQYAISRGPKICDIDYLHILTGSRPHHMLQHAIRLNNFKMVGMICDTNANLNLFVEVREYFRGPLYFEALLFDGTVDPKIYQKVLTCNIDLTLKDEKGRSALHYVIDRRQGHVPVEVVERLLEMGINTAMRDQNGSTARDVAVFERRADVIEAIDHHLIEFVRATDMDNLYSLALEGYDSIIIEYQYRDTWIFANGNTNNIVTKFVEELPEFQKQATSIHTAIENGDFANEIQYIVDTYGSNSFTKDMLLQYKDKGGRNALMKAVLYGEEETVEWLLEQQIKNQLRCVDNLGRGLGHYSVALSSEGIGSQHLLGGEKVPKVTDWSGKNGEDVPNKLIEEEKQKQYGLELKLHCALKYSKMLKIIHNPKRSMKHLNQTLKELEHPVAKLPMIFHENIQAPVVADYTDLLFEAIDHNREDMACKLAFLGADYSIRKPYCDVLWSDSPVWLNPLERAQHLEMTTLVNTLEKYGTQQDYWGLGVKKYVQMYQDTEKERKRREEWKNNPKNKIFF